MDRNREEDGNGSLQDLFGDKGYNSLLGEACCEFQEDEIVLETVGLEEEFSSISTQQKTAKRQIFNIIREKPRIWSELELLQAAGIEVFTLSDAHVANTDLEDRKKKISADKDADPHSELQQVLAGHTIYTGFHLTGETCAIQIAAPTGVQRRWTILSGKPKVGRYGSNKKVGKATIPAYNIWLYRGVYRGPDGKDDPNKDDGERFMFIPGSKSNQPTHGDCYIRMVDVYERIQGGDEGLKVILQDDKTWRTTKDMTFKLWNENGKVDEIRMFRFRGALNPLRESATQDVPTRHFQFWAGTLAKAQGNRVSSNNPYGRYWDEPIPKENLEAVSSDFLVIFSEEVREKLLNNGTASDTEHARTIVFKWVQIALSAKFNFKPKLKLKNIWFNGAFIEMLETDKPDNLVVLEHHPGLLYAICLGPVCYSAMSNMQNPFEANAWLFPEAKKAETVNGEMKIAGKLSSRSTFTVVDQNGINSARKKKRKPDQPDCMDKEGYTAAKAFNELWKHRGMTLEYAEKKRLTEWLHRSAFSYGGLWTRPKKPGDEPIPPKAPRWQTSQTATNLILGSREANSVMMRYESFIQRLVANAKGGGIRGPSVWLETSFDYAGQEWLRAKDYCWLTPALKYRYYTPPGVEPRALLQTRTINPFNCEPCMVFAAVLDKVVEKQFWDWDVTKLEATSDLDSDSDSEEEEEEEEEKEKSLKK